MIFFQHDLSGCILPQSDEKGYIKYEKILFNIRNGRKALMADSDTSPLPRQGPRTKDSVMASTLIGSHSIEHMYGHGFQVLLPAIYVAFGLAPI